MATCTVALLYFVAFLSFSYICCQTTREYQSLNRKINLLRQETFEKGVSLEREISFMKFELADLKSELQAEKLLTAGLSKHQPMSEGPTTGVNQESGDEIVNVQTDTAGAQENITELEYDITELTKDINKIKESNVSWSTAMNHAFQAEKISRKHIEKEVKKQIDETMSDINKSQNHFIDEINSKISHTLKVMDENNIHVANNVSELKEYASVTRSLLCGNGTFVHDSSQKHTYCECTPGYGGVHCENDIDECANNPCMNGGTCTNGQNKFTCTCTAGWTGITCATANLDECASNPCLNGGTCSNGQDKFTCTCTAGWTETTCATVITDCFDVQHFGIGSSSGVYLVYLPTSNTELHVYCDMVTEGGGWTVFQYRFDGSVDFYLPFAQYENGFGDVNGEFWLGLKYIHEMAYQKTNEIYLHFVDSTGLIAMEHFSNFTVGAADTNYTLTIGSLLLQNDTRTTNSLIYNKGAKFSANDFDYDTATRDCAKHWHAGWWFNVGTFLNPNGEYVTPGSKSTYGYGWGGMINYGWKKRASLKSTKLMFRRI